MQLFWYPPLKQVWMYSYNSSDMAEQFAAAAGPTAAQNHLVTAQAVGGRRHLAQGPHFFSFSHLLKHMLPAISNLGKKMTCMLSHKPIHDCSPFSLGLDRSQSPPSAGNLDTYSDTSLAMVIIITVLQLRRLHWPLMCLRKPRRLSLGHGQHTSRHRLRESFYPVQQAMLHWSHLVVMQLTHSCCCAFRSRSTSCLS